MPIKDETIECITSYGGFESMQCKTMDGFNDAYRVLKAGCHTIYNMSIVDDKDSFNTKKWIKLLHTYPHKLDTALFEKMIEITDWEQKCCDVGYKHTESTKIYGELPAPDTDVFPYENMILRWMGEYVCSSKK